jgi:hypothetical protein
MAKEEGIFTVAEDEQIQGSARELISVGEDELKLPEIGQKVSPPNVFVTPPERQPAGAQKPQPMPAGGEKPEQMANENGWRNTKKPEHFTQFLADDLARIPRPNAARGNQALMERTLGQYKKLNNYVSQALREDYDDVLDAVQVDKARKFIEQCIDELEMGLEGLDNLKKNRKKMRRGEYENELVKEANTPGFAGIQMQVSAFEGAIIRALINGTVSGGRNMEELFAEAKQKYDITPREELAIFQTLADFGYPTFKDRLRLGDTKVDTSKSEEGGEWQAQYYS